MDGCLDVFPIYGHIHTLKRFNYGSNEGQSGQSKRAPPALYPGTPGQCTLSARAVRVHCTRGAPVQCRGCSFWLPRLLTWIFPEMNCLGNDIDMILWVCDTTRLLRQNPISSNNLLPFVGDHQTYVVRHIAQSVSELFRHCQDVEKRSQSAGHCLVG